MTNTRDVLVDLGLRTVAWAGWRLKVNTDEPRGFNGLDIVGGDVRHHPSLRAGFRRRSITHMPWLEL